jgi:glucosamine--fructose-6-phosphate aminotransferase (isomerizing)
LALVDNSIPVLVIAPKDNLLNKIKANMQEVSARGGELFVFTDLDSQLDNNPVQKEALSNESPKINIIKTPRHVGILSPIVHVISVQLLAYHTAVIRGTDVDKPRNLAKSVTVE